MDSEQAKEGDAENNGDTNVDSEQLEQLHQPHPQPMFPQPHPQPMFPLGMMMSPAMMMSPGGMMAGASAQEMMEEMMEMAGPSYGPPGYGPPGFDPSSGMKIMPSWMVPQNGSNHLYDGSTAADNSKGDSKGKKSKTTEQQSDLAKRQSKRRRNSNDAKNATAGNANDSQTTNTEPEVHIELMTESWKKNVLDKFPRCKSAEGIRDTSYFATTRKGQNIVAAGGEAGMGHGSRLRRAAEAAVGRATAAVGAMSNIQCLRKLLSELNRMEYEDAEQLPGGIAPIWLRYDDECPQYMRAIITGPPRDTPYSNGLFAFDIYVPDSYPQIPPKVQLLTTGGGKVRFGPNLYADGKVCLSLLGTWSGPRWDPRGSSLSQILISIQGLILGVEHPYYLEPGYGGWEGSHGNDAAKIAMAHGTPPSGSANGAKGGDASGGADKYAPPQVRTFENRIRLGTLKHAIGDYCTDMIRSRSSMGAKTSQHYLSAFEDILRAHFWNRKECIKADAKKWINMAHSQHQKRKLQMVLKGLESALGRLEGPSSVAMDTAASVSNGAAAASAADGKLAANDGKDQTVNTERSYVSPEMAAKEREMEVAVAKGDYILAGRIQSQMKLSGKVHSLIASRTEAMEDAAARKDYVEAGRLQLVVQHLESNRMRLQDLERRMFESAARQDFVKAGRFQEQYRVLMEAAEAEDRASSPTASSGAAPKATSGTLSSLAGAVASAAHGKSAGKMHFVNYGGGGGGWGDDYYGGGYPDEYGDY